MLTSREDVEKYPGADISFSMLQSDVEPDLNAWLGALQTKYQMHLYNEYMILKKTKGLKCHRVELHL